MNVAFAAKQVRVPLHPEELDWIAARGAHPVNLLRALLSESMRASILKKALAEEDHVLALIRRRAKDLREAATAGPFDGVLAEQLRARAEREVLRECARDADRLIRAAARRVCLRSRLEAGRTDNHLHRGTDALRRLRLQRPGGWR